jgi:hypothetical protein
MKLRADLEIRMKKLAMGTAALVVAFAAVGCQESAPPPTPPVVNLPPNNFDPNVDAGWKGVRQAQLDATLVADLKGRTAGNHGQSFASRNDPFALLNEERSFDSRQTSERFLSEQGFRFDYEEPPPPRPVDVVEPQPYRRLAGVIVGESVLALIDMGDGRLEIIRPGQRIPNSEWTVVSIDEEKAILRRGGNRLPRQIVVRLESPPFQGGGGTGTPGGGGPGGGFGGGRPGVPPGGPPGLGGGAGAGAGDDN